MAISKNHEVRLLLSKVLRELSTRCRNAKEEYKESQRASGGVPSTVADDKRCAYTRLSTLLCTAQAHRRGKVHDPKRGGDIGAFIREAVKNINVNVPNTLLTGMYYVKMREVWTPELVEALLFAAEGKPSVGVEAPPAIAATGT